MSRRHKRVLIAILSIVLIYAITPFVACIIGTSDRRGPKIYAVEHHDILYRIGYKMAGRGKPRVPFMQERHWFYGVQGAPLPKQQKR